MSRSRRPGRIPGRTRRTGRAAAGEATRQTSDGELARRVRGELAQLAPEEPIGPLDGGQDEER